MIPSRSLANAPVSAKTPLAELSHGPPWLSVGTSAATKMRFNRQWGYVAGWWLSHPSKKYESQLGR